MSKHSRRSVSARRVRAVASAGLVAVFVALAAAGLLGHDLIPGYGDGSDATLADSSAGPVSTSPAGGAATATPGASGSPASDSPVASGSSGTSGSSGSSGSPGSPGTSTPPATAVASPRPPRQKILRAGPALEPIPEPVASSFRIASYNVEGSQHKADGPGRARTAAGIIADRGIDLVGLQEVQDDQRAAIAAALPGYGIWPGDSLGNQGYRHQILYRTDRFEIVGGGSVPYTFDSQTVPLPYAQLRDKQSGGEFYLIDAHNSARGLQAQRDSATGIEADLINQLKSSGLPVLITIDSNEHTEWFCRIAGDTGVTSANGGYWSDGCRLPSGPLRIDWIAGVGTGDAAVDFSDYVQDITPQRIGISDHYLIYADATVTSPPPDDDDQGNQGDGSSDGG